MMRENLQCWGWSYLLLPEGLEQLLRQSVFKNRVAAVEPDGVSRSVGYPYACWTNSQRMISRSCLRIFHDITAESRRPSRTCARARFQHLCARFRYRRACGRPVGRDTCALAGG